MTRKEAEILIDKYLAGTCTPEEKDLVESVYNLTSAQGSAQISKEQLAEERKAMFAKLRPASSPIRKLQPYIKIAAAILVVAAIATYFYNKKESGNWKPLSASAVSPGSNRAVLTLANGQAIKLDSAQSGIIVNDEHIVYNDKTPLNVILSGERRNEGKGAEGSLPNLLSLSTPKGGQYQIILSDGTKVWLNAQSTLKYPSRFSGDTRTVEISGEAFFDVAQAKDKPFTVKSNDQETVVLGTEFNINSYEPTIKTTLVSGAVQIVSNAGSKLALSPGEQSMLDGTALTKAKADIESVTAWRKGYFRFSEDLESIMKQVSRWYNVEVVFKSEAIKRQQILGIVYRDKPLADVLTMLEKASDAKFKVEQAISGKSGGRRVVVTE